VLSEVLCRALPRFATGNNILALCPWVVLGTTLEVKTEDNLGLDVPFEYKSDILVAGVDDDMVIVVRVVPASGPGKAVLAFSVSTSRRTHCLAR
jgi:hypothetical protein